MASGKGVAIVDFGTGNGSNEASVAVTGQTTISATSVCEAWVMASNSTVDHTADDHKYFPVFAAVTCGAPTTGVGFTIFARSTQKLTGKWNVNYVWAD